MGRPDVPEPTLETPVHETDAQCGQESRPHPCHQPDEGQRDSAQTDRPRVDFPRSDVSHDRGDETPESQRNECQGNINAQGRLIPGQGCIALCHSLG